MIKVNQTPHGNYLVLRHETDGAIAPDGTLVPPVITECQFEIPAMSFDGVAMIVEEIREHLEDCGALEHEEEAE